MSRFRIEDSWGENLDKVIKILEMFGESMIEMIVWIWVKWKREEKLRVLRD